MRTKILSLETGDISTYVEIYDNRSVVISTSLVMHPKTPEEEADIKHKAYMWEKTKDGVKIVMRTVIPMDVFTIILSAFRKDGGECFFKVREDMLNQKGGGK